jgi:excisionase family DNA binding protein
MAETQTPDSLKSVAFLSPAELSQRWKVSGMTLRRWRADNRIRALHIGRQIRFAVSEIERFEANAIA